MAIKCKHPRCSKWASFGTNNKREYCVDHKPNNAKRIGNDFCKSAGCELRANYGLLGKSPEYCSEHALTNMIEIYGKTCNYTGCETSGSRYYDKKWYCVEHAPDGSKNTNRTCKFPKCTTQSTFGYPNGKPQYCDQHKLKEMINVTSRRCKVSECGKTPVFGKVGDIFPEFCSYHAPNHYVNVVGKRCVITDCDKIACCGYLFRKKTHCYRHKLSGHYLSTKPKCEEHNCGTRPYYTNDGTNYPKRCFDHKLGDDKNVVEKPCKSCGLMYHLNEGTDLCEDCGNFNKGVQKLKELEVKAVLDGAGIKYQSYDSKIDDGCSKYRPDFVIDRGTFNVVVECDENQHSSYSPECELARMYQIFQDFGGKYVVFIRFNPDNYTTGTQTYRPSSKRYGELLRAIEYFCNKITLDVPIGVVYLFYDGYLGNFIKIRHLIYQNGACTLQ